MTSSTKNSDLKRITVMCQKTEKTWKSNKEFDMAVADSSANVGKNREIRSLCLEFSSDDGNDNVAGKSFLRLVPITKTQF